MFKFKNVTMGLLHLK